MITCDRIKKDVIKTQCCYVFDYKNQPCGIDPTSKGFNVWYGDKELEASDWEQVVTTKFFDGQTLRDILKDIKNYGLG